MAKQPTPEPVTKAQAMRDALQALPANASNAEIADWIKKNRGLDLIGNRRALAILKGAQRKNLEAKKGNTSGILPAARATNFAVPAPAHTPPRAASVTVEDLGEIVRLKNRLGTEVIQDVLGKLDEARR